jgi:hypothetical protein
MSNPIQPPQDPPTILHQYVDEAGDPTIFNAKGKVIVGTEGCSAYLMLGKVDVHDPDGLNADLEKLRQELLSDPYFRNVSSFQPERKKTALSFHAKDDLPEVRMQVFCTLLKHDFRFQAVIRDKSALVSFVRQENERNPSYRYNQNEQYDLLVAQLFKSGFYKADEFRITFSKRGNKSRTHAFRAALENARQSFEHSYGIKAKAKVEIAEAMPPGNPGLQAVDYLLWAIQRFYEGGWEKDEGDRFVQLVWPKVSAIHDLDDRRENAHGEIYRGDKLLTVEAMKARNKKR